jgi:sulfur-oxidizing protein SoxX
MIMFRLLPILVLAVPAIAMAQPAPAADPAHVDPARVEKVVAATFAKASPEWQARVTQDETQRLCSLRRNKPTAAEAVAIMKREQASVTMPADGQVLGDWRRGEEIALNGRGGQFSDDPKLASGGNCYACHQMAASEITYGTLAPSLLQYGKQKDYSADAARAAYVKVYDAQAIFPCSMMPRFGHNQVLTEQQMKDVVAYLFDPDSPVNK